MKKLLILLLLLCSTSTFAEKVRFNVQPFSGSFNLKVDSVGVEAKDIKLESITVTARAQFCNVWATACADGPKKEIKIDATFIVKEDVLTIDSAKNIKASKNMLFNKFRSCNLEVTAKGSTDDGNRYTGVSKIIQKNFIKFCNSEDAVTRYIELFFDLRPSMTLRRDYY